MTTSIIATLFGASLVVSCSEDAIIVAEFRSHASVTPKIRHPLLREAADQVRAYLSRKLKVFDLPLTFHGAPFACQAWRAVSQLGFGEFVSYADVARAVGHPHAHRGVAAAMGKTPLALFVPAHRVIGSDGKLKGCDPGSMRARLAAFERGYVPEPAPSVSGP